MGWATRRVELVKDIKQSPRWATRTTRTAAYAAVVDSTGDILCIQHGHESAPSQGEQTAGRDVQARPSPSTQWPKPPIHRSQRLRLDFFFDLDHKEFIIHFESRTQTAGID
ncbi:hypothetical protein ED733_002843 [Metarhizium rileyi]|uniref:Uncharacterized protein n=1 Tax=Metarhizium rileyi (strain RCEF 4871) TaxID=1649241 RepID=A0A5C6G231_METRR|nr:hypothetical protein ED733_002843 [Metarhizium rileyi]